MATKPPIGWEVAWPHLLPLRSMLPMLEVSPPNAPWPKAYLGVEANMDARVPASGTCTAHDCSQNCYDLVLFKKELRFRKG